MLRRLVRTQREGGTLNIFLNIQVVLVNNPRTYRILPPNLRIGLSLLNRTSIVNAVLADSVLKEELLAAVVNELMRECDHLCGKKKVSTLRKSKADDLLQFSWEKLQSEWKEEAPTLYRILTAVATPRLAAEFSENKLPSVCVAGSILLRSRNLHMSTLQHLIGLILFHGNVRKQVTIWTSICDNKLFNVLFVSPISRLILD